MMFRCFAAIALLVVWFGPTVSTAQHTHPLLRAQALDMDNLGANDAATLYEAAEWLNNWSKMIDRAPIVGDKASYLAAIHKANKIYQHLHEVDATKAAYLIGMASSMYNVGEMFPEEAKDKRMARYEKMVELMKTCVEEVDPKNAICWTLLGVAYGRLGTTRGVLSSAFLAKNVESAWEKALELNSPHVSLNGDPITIDTTYGLAVFYRIVPDHWLVQLITRTRGNKKKSIAYLRRIAELQPDRLELQKELAVALLCYGDDESEMAAIAEAKEILRNLIAGKFDARDNRMTDEIDKAHAQELLNRPAKDACGYSRDGFQDLSDDALQEAKQKHSDTKASP